jgi:hypothetical protein
MDASSLGSPPKEMLRLARFGGAEPGLESIRWEASGRFMLPPKGAAPLPPLPAVPPRPGIPPKEFPNPGGVCFSSVVDMSCFIYMLVIYNDCVCMMYMQGVICTALYIYVKGG